MKRVYILVLILSLMIAGCKGTSDNSSTSETVVNMEQKEDNQQITKVPATKAPATIAATEAPTEVTSEDTLVDQTKEEVASSNVSETMALDYPYSRKPEVADWSDLKKKIISLDASNMWGSSFDFRLEDLSSLDLTNEIDRMNNIVFDTITVWPEKLPEGFDPNTVLELGKNPGLGIRSLHEEGITGKGVNIAIIDQPLLLEHIEYAGQIKLYDEVNSGGTPASMHGPFVASLSVGKTCGVAPDAELYFIGNYNMELSSQVLDVNYNYFAEAIDKLLGINKTLPEDDKIRVLSISACWCPDNKGYIELTQAIDRAKEEGIFVISCNLFENYGFWTYSTGKGPLDDPDNTESYSIYPWNDWMKMVSHIPGFTSYYEDKFTQDFAGELLLIPIGSRTYAEPTGKDVYSFNVQGGWSAMEPYLAGLYALACQVKNDITPEMFWQAALETGDLKEVTRGDEKFPAKLINPVKLIKSLQ